MHREISHLHVERESRAHSSITCIGINHRTAPAAVRERVTFPAVALPGSLRSARIDAGIDRLVILSTCNRTELYAEVAAGQGFAASQALLRWLASSRSIPVESIAVHAYSLSGEDAIRHLYRLAAGLESLVPGEPQIITQVAGALRHSVAAHAASPLLKKIFKNAVRAGERARSAVWGRFRAANLGTAAVAAASVSLDRRGARLQESSVAVVGAGELAVLTLAAFASAGVTDVTILNRTRHRALSAAAGSDARVRDLDDLESTLAETRLAVFAVSGRKALVKVEMMDRVSRDRTSPLTIVDVAMPRNVDPAVRSIAGVELLDIDDLAKIGTDMYASRRQAAVAVEQIVDEALSDLRISGSVSARETQAAGA